MSAGAFSVPGAVAGKPAHVPTMLTQTAECAGCGTRVRYLLAERDEPYTLQDLLQILLTQYPAWRLDLRRGQFMPLCPKCPSASTPIGSLKAGERVILVDMTGWWMEMTVPSGRPSLEVSNFPPVSYVHSPTQPDVVDVAHFTLTTETAFGNRRVLRSGAHMLDKSRWLPPPAPIYTPMAFPLDTVSLAELELVCQEVQHDAQLYQMSFGLTIAGQRVMISLPGLMVAMLREIERLRAHTEDPPPPPSAVNFDDVL